MSINKVILVGNVGKDVETKEVGNGNKVANFSLATSESYTDKQGQKQTVTEWHNLVIWGKLAEIAEKYVTKGQQLYVEGKIKTRSWEKDGQKHYTTEIYVDNLQILSKKQEQNEQQHESQPETGLQQKSIKQQIIENITQPEEDDLPF